MIPHSTSATRGLLSRMTVATKLWLAIVIALALGLILILIGFSADQRHFSEQQLNTFGQIISQQTATGSAPLMLAGDLLSLTINLQQLTDLPQIDGVEVVDNNGTSLALVGRPGKLTQQRPIRTEQTLLGSVHIYLNPAAASPPLSQALPLTLIAAFSTVLLLAIATLVYNRHLSVPLRALHNAAEQLSRNTPITPLQQQRNDELGQIAELLNQRFAEHPVEPIVQTTAQPVTSASPAIDSEATVDSTALRSADTAVNRSLKTTDTSYHSTTGAAGHTPPLPTTPQPTGAIAAFTLEPSTTPAADLSQNGNPSTADSESSPGAGQTLGAETSNDAITTYGYLLYINHHVGGSDTLTSSEREQLLVRYRKSLEQVTRLYKGTLNEDVLDNWCVRFSPLSSDQSHGINALCAAQLFSALYRGINAQAIRSFSPALNIKLVLLCGPVDNFDALSEDALLLSDRIQDNALITHQALHQIPALQDRLLGNAKYRKFDDDTYLITELNSDYQTLIDRQAEHFLKQSV